MREKKKKEVFFGSEYEANQFLNFNTNYLIYHGHHSIDYPIEPQGQCDASTVYRAAANTPGKFWTDLVTFSYSPLKNTYV